MAKHKDGFCPCCEAEIEYIGLFHYDNEGATVDFECPRCGTIGKAEYVFAFDGYYGIQKP